MAKGFADIAVQQGWDRDSTISILSNFISEQGLGASLARYADAVAREENGDNERYWIQDSVAQDTPDVPMPFGDATVGIVDEDQGGVFLYVHESNAQATLLLLRSA